MSTVSFFIHGIHFETGRELPCSCCGVKGTDTVGATPGTLPHCPACGGYGGVAVDQSPFVLTVSDLMAQEIIRVLRLGVQVGYSGSTSPDRILTFTPVTAQRAEHSYWLPRLRRIAKKAKQYKRWVVWHANR